MRLVTFQSIDALKDLLTKGYLECNEQNNKFEKLLDVKSIVVQGKGHISQDDNVFELEEILAVCKKMIK